MRLGERAELVCTPDVDGLQVYAGCGGHKDSGGAEDNCYRDCRRRHYMGAMVIRARR